MIEVKPLTRDKACAGCSLQDREMGEALLGRPLQYTQVYIFVDPQFRPSQSLCEFCALALYRALGMVLGETDGPANR